MGKSSVQRELIETAETLPIYSVLSDLFTDEKMFDSHDRLADEGFEILDNSSTKILCASHPRAPGYLFKKYDNKRGKRQLPNYMRRVEGARILRSFIAEHGYTSVYAPRKWLYKLPSDFSERYLVVTEKLDLMSRDETKEAYDHIEEKQMRELATILYYFRGLSSTAGNLPYAKDGRIVFIDTERWYRDRKYLRKVGKLLPSRQREFAEAVHDDLEQRGEQQYQSAYDGEDDFELEEDTSSLSSSS